MNDTEILSDAGRNVLRLFIFFVAAIMTFVLLEIGYARGYREAAIAMHNNQIAVTKLPDGSLVVTKTTEK